MSTIAKTIQQLEKPNFPFKPSPDFYGTIGMSKKRFWAIYKGKTQPRLDEMQSIAKCLGVSVNDFIVENESPL